MNDIKLTKLGQVEDFLKGTQEITFKGLSKEEGWVGCQLQKAVDRGGWGEL